MTDQIDQDKINYILWKTYDYLRGIPESNVYRNYIVVLLFIKYLSDIQYDNDENCSQKFVMPDDCDFNSLYIQRDNHQLGEIINRTLNRIEDANKEKLKYVLSSIDFNNRDSFLSSKHDLVLKSLLEFLNDLPLISHIGNSYKSIIREFSRNITKYEPISYTPLELSLLLTKLLDPQPGDRIYDPVCGIGSLLLNFALNVVDQKYTLWGQETNQITWAKCLINMYVNNIDVDTHSIQWGDVLTDPKLITTQGMLEQFNVVVGNLPMSLRWDAEIANRDRFGRFYRGIPPASKGDYALITHMIESMYTAPSQNGRMGVIVSHGVLFRGGVEGKIRQKLIDENLLEAVIGLPQNLLFGTSVPSVILIFKRNKLDDRVLFIDASKEFEVSQKQNKLREIDINKIVETYRNRVSVNRYAHLAEKSEIEANDYNLNIARYIFAYEIPDQQIVFSIAPEQHDVFISYSRKDKDRKDKIVGELLTAGMRIWEDDNYTLDVGTPDWQMQIEKSIEASNCVVVLLSPDAKESSWVRRELTYAQTHNKPIFPVLIEGTEQTSLPLLLISDQYANLKSDYQKQLKELIDTLKERVGIREIRTPYIYNLEKENPSWKTEKLLDLVDVLIPKQRIDRNSLKEDGNYPFYSPSGLQGYCDDYEFEGEFILIPKMISSIHEQFTKNAWKPENTHFSASKEVYVLKPHAEISIDFLLYTLWVTDFTEKLKMGDSGRRRIDLSSIKITLPSLDKQNEIIGYINEQLDVINSRQKKLETRIKILDSRKIGEIHRAFQD